MTAPAHPTVASPPVRPWALRPAASDAFPELQRRVKAPGLLDPRPGYYAAKIAFNLLLLAAGWATLVLVGNSWWVIAVGVYMAFAYTQTGFIGHDIGHRQVTRNRRWQDVLGLLHGNLLMGFSYGWWVGHHNKHHSNPNHLEKDSDITRRRAARNNSSCVTSTCCSTRCSSPRASGCGPRASRHWLASYRG